MFHGGWWEVYLEIEFVAGSSARLLGTGRREAAPPAAVLAVTPGREQRPWRPGVLDVSASCQPQRCWEPSPAPQCPHPACQASVMVFTFLGLADCRQTPCSDQHLGLEGDPDKKPAFFSI